MEVDLERAVLERPVLQTWRPTGVVPGRARRAGGAAGPAGAADPA